MQGFSLRFLVLGLGGALLVPQMGFGEAPDTLPSVELFPGADTKGDSVKEDSSSAEESPAVGSVGAARSFVQKMGEEAIEVLMDSQRASQERFSMFKKILLTDFDVQGIGCYLIGEDTYKGLKSSEQEEYDALLPDYIVKLYLGKFEEYRKEGFSKDNFTVQRAFLRNSKDPQSPISVNSTMKLPGGAGLLKIDWRIFNTPNGLKILDVYVDNLSMSQTKRDEFRSLLAGGGFQELITKLRAQVGTAS